MPRIAPLCTPPSRPCEYKGSETFAVQGRGYCYCSWAGNCRLWIYRKHRSKYEKLFVADDVQAFAFLPVRDNLPFLFLWTRNSAVRFSARAPEFNGVEYHNSDGWIEQYQYEDEDGDFSVYDVPRILRESFPEEPPPECASVSAILNGHLSSAFACIGFCSYWFLLVLAFACVAAAFRGGRFPPKTQACHPSGIR
jgi:hypothetical protein